MIIPLSQLSDETLTAIIEEFILREESDNNLSMPDKVSLIKEKLVQGSLIIVYSQLYENVNIIARDSLNDMDESDYNE